MKKIERNIVTGIENIGVNDIYPTQVMVDASNLELCDRGQYKDIVTGDIISIHHNDSRFLSFKKDGFTYDSILMVPGYEDGVEQFDELSPNTRYIGKINGKLGFVISGIDENTLRDGVVLSEGTYASMKNPDDLNKVREVSYNYYEDGEAFGFKYGAKGYEPVIATGKYKAAGFVSADEELKQVMKNTLGKSL